MPQCLASVKDVVDYYIINDNGSTDGTPELIKQIMDGYGIEGEVFHTEWFSAQENREMALQKFYEDGRWDYALIMDADGTLHYNNGVFDNLTADGYLMTMKLGTTEYKLPMLLGKTGKWYWKEKVHSHVAGEGTMETLDGAWMTFTNGTGARSQGVTQKQKFLRDAFNLEAELEKEPDNKRNTFYLAQSYRDAGVPELAYKYYMKRVEMGGWDEEVYQAMYYAAMAKLRMGVSPVELLLDAYQFRPIRAEPLFQLMEWYRHKKQYELGYLFGKKALALQIPDERLFVDHSIYDWRIMDSLSVCAYWIGRYEESCHFCIHLLTPGIDSIRKLPDSEVARVEKNRDYAKEKMSHK